MEIACTSRITQVVVHARGALVTRRVEVPAELPDGDVELLVPGVTVLAEGASMRAAVVDSARAVVSVRTALVVPETEVKPGPSVERVRALDARMERLRAEHVQLSSQRQGLAGLLLAPRFTRGRAEMPLEAIDDRCVDALATSALAAELAARFDARMVELEDALRDLQHAREAAALEDAQAASAARMGAGQPSRRVAVHVHGRGPVGGVELSYVVPAARWWPVYTLRVVDGGRRATWWLEALVAQLTGEDWNGVRLGLSTADLLYDARLPELPSLRYGRAQPLARRGYRPAPAGLDGMFQAWDRAFVTVTSTTTVTTETRAELTRTGVLDESVELLDEEPAAEQARALPEAGALPAGEALAIRGREPDARPEGIVQTRAGVLRRPSMPEPSAPRAKGVLFGSVGEGGGGYGAPQGRPPEPEAIEPAEAWLDFDALALAGAEDRERRGRLVRARDLVGEGARSAAAQRVDALEPRASLRDPQASRGRFDHRYDAGGVADLPSDGQAHRVMVSVAEATPTLRWRAVPLESPEVYREAELKNPFDAPLIAGPVDVYLEGSLLAATEIEGVDRGGAVHVGMGVEERIRVARNVRMEEETTGILGGSTTAAHTVTIELASALRTPALVDVLDRVPVTEDKTVEVQLLGEKPEAEAYTQAERGAAVRGGRRWKMILPPGGKSTIEMRYRITLPSKNEVVGGNRRE